MQQIDRGKQRELAKKNVKRQKQVAEDQLERDRKAKQKERLAGRQGATA